ncbi:MAG TPA: L-threonylcarbamoyladenylate synthase [Actinomycetota bacterium]|nr:L-threonylcarbamoyladenylate synthase [Actinomycetota bacterium]
MADPVAGIVEAVRRGDLVVLPTDTVYGIGTRPDDPTATRGVFAAKGRPADLELPVLVAGVGQARRIAAFDHRAEALVARFWAGPLTLVLPRSGSSRSWELGGDPETIGVRMPRHPLALEILRRAGPLAVTSANRSGEATPGDCAEVRRTFGETVAIYLCDPAPLTGPASTVVDLAHGDPRILRAGAVAQTDVWAALTGI